MMWDEIISQSKESDTPIYIYGAGGLAEELIEILTYLYVDVRLECIVSNVVGNSEKIHGISVKRFDSCKNINKDSVIIVSVWGNGEEIYNSLLNKGYVNVLIYRRDVRNLLTKKFFKKKTMEFIN